MRSPLRVEYFSDLDRNEDSSGIFPRVWCQAFDSLSGRVVYVWSIRRILPSIYPSLLRDGVTLRVECGFPPTRSRWSLLWIAGRYSFRMGSPFFESDSSDLISIEGITTVGLLGASFRPVLGVSAVVLGSAGLLWSQGSSSFSCLHFWWWLCVYPSRQRRSGSWPFFFWPCCLSPSPGGSVCFGGRAVILFARVFHAMVFCAWWLASGTSGSRTSR